MPLAANCVCVRAYVHLCFVYSGLTWRGLRLAGLVGEGLGDFPEWGVDI